MPFFFQATVLFAIALLIGKNSHATKGKALAICVENYAEVVPYSTRHKILSPIAKKISGISERVGKRVLKGNGHTHYRLLTDHGTPQAARLVAKTNDMYPQAAKLLDDTINAYKNLSLDNILNGTKAVHKNFDNASGLLKNSKTYPVKMTEVFFDSSRKGFFESEELVLIAEHTGKLH